uniref:Uncharacterized protein n=1 Tax=viral metagenome TaxID=1070528 RepID=A0A6M3IF50_9ZZZZ
MEKKLLNSTIKFSLACLGKLEEKESNGWGGWDWEACKTSFEKRIKHDAKSKLTQKSLVNIANYCMFLWNLIENKREVT